MDGNKNKLDEKEIQWQISRKSFVRTILLSGVALQLPWLSSCENSESPYINPHPLTLKQLKIIREVQQTLFPDDGNGPSATQLNADKYLLWVLQDPLLDPEENKFLIDGIDKLNNDCLELNKANFYTLFESDKNDFIRHISELDWGETWLSRILTLIFEALLLDPQYGSNPDGMGWKWLNHNPGQPRPQAIYLYPSILKKYDV